MKLSGNVPPMILNILSWKLMKFEVQVLPSKVFFFPVLSTLFPTNFCFVFCGPLASPAKFISGPHSTYQDAFFPPESSLPAGNLSSHREALFPPSPGSPLPTGKLPSYREGGSYHPTGTLSSNWEAFSPLWSSFPTGKLSSHLEVHSHWEAFSPPGSSLPTGMLSSHREALFPPGSWKLPFHREATFPLGSSLPCWGVGSSLPTGKFSSH